MENERYSRQKDLVPEGKLAHRRVTVIGVGATGRQIALQLAAMGVQWLQLIDHDKVEESNIASQGYKEKHLNHYKVTCTGGDCIEINSNLEIDITMTKFNDTIEHGDTIFNCVDRITTRREIWDMVGDAADFYCDGRMAAESFRVISVRDEASRLYYPTTLFAQEEAYQGSCTAKSTIYCANVIAGIMVSQFAKHLRDLPVEKDVSYNLLASELTVLKE